MIKELALKYLGYKDKDEMMLKTMDAYLEELERYVSFKVFYQVFDYANQTIQDIDVYLDSQDAKVYFAGCDRIMVIVATLGIQVEKYLRMLQKSDMTKCVIMDALASASLEVKLDEYEKFIKEKRTYRFAPGYGDMPLSINREIYEKLDLHKKIGVTLTDSSLFVPQKSMLGLIGLGNENRTKSCMHCIRYDACSLRKEGITCWKD